MRAAVTAIHKDEVSRLWRLRAEGHGFSAEVEAANVLVATGAFTNQNKVLPAGRRLALHAFMEPNLLFEVGDGQLERLRRLPPVVTVDPEDTGDS